MTLLQISTVFDWKELLIGTNNWSFLLETILRTSVMFILILVSLRVLGKRGVKQLSVFELVVIIGLGSAAGDPMFYKNVGLLTTITVFSMVVILYKFTTYLVGKSKKFERLVEGKSVCLIKGGRFSIENYKKEALGEDEFFAELRLQSISHLGQVEEAIEESSGNISIFYYTDDAVKYGLPIMPDSLETSHQEIQQRDHYSCVFCGYTVMIEPVSKYTCPVCNRLKWVKASNKKRIC